MKRFFEALSWWHKVLFHLNENKEQKTLKANLFLFFTQAVFLHHVYCVGKRIRNEVY